MIKTDKPIVWFDCETTGIDRENDRIVELCMIKIHPDGKKQVIMCRDYIGTLIK